MPHCEKSTIYVLEREAGRPEILYDRISNTGRDAQAGLEAAQ
jgi:hypothetical protein